MFSLGNKEILDFISLKRVFLIVGFFRIICLFVEFIFISNFFVFIVFGSLRGLVTFMVAWRKLRFRVRLEFAFVIFFLIIDRAFILGLRLGF